MNLLDRIRLDQDCPRGSPWATCDSQGVNMQCPSSHPAPESPFSSCSSKQGLRGPPPTPCPVGEGRGAVQYSPRDAYYPPTHMWCNRVGKHLPMHVHGVKPGGGAWLPLVQPMWCATPADVARGACGSCPLISWAALMLGDPGIEKTVCQTM